jgi:cyanophycin synthetase
MIFACLVVGDKLVAAARRDPPKVVGDGVHTMPNWSPQVNLDPRRGSGPLHLTDQRSVSTTLPSCLASQGFKADDIPAKGQRVNLRNNANLSTGGSATDVTDDVHPDVAARAVAAAHMVGLDICGVDLVCDSILRPIEELGGGIVEVNAAPGLRMHLSPSFGKGRAVGEAIISSMFKNGRWAYSHRCGHRHQWKNHHGAPDFPPVDTKWLVRGHDQHRRCLCGWKLHRYG